MEGWTDIPFYTWLFTRYIAPLVAFAALIAGFVSGWKLWRGKEDFERKIGVGLMVLCPILVILFLVHCYTTWGR